MDWLEVKFGEKAVDLIISYPPFPSRVNPEKEIMKIYEELFYNADYILKPGGKVILLSREYNLLLDAAEKYKFKHKELDSFEKGDIGFVIFEFSK